MWIVMTSSAAVPSSCLGVTIDGTGACSRATARLNAGQFLIWLLRSSVALSWRLMIPARRYRAT